MPIRLGTPLPDLSAPTWINGEPDRAALRGRPLLVHFWSASCGVCHDNMPTVGAWRDAFRAMGLNVVSLHVPRAGADFDEATVRAHVLALGISEPCGLDRDRQTYEAFQNTFVPSYYLFDAAGTLRSRAGGAAGLEMMRAALARYTSDVPPAS